MKTFNNFALSESWPSAADAFRADLAAGDRVQIAPWGGYAILGYHELVALARNPLADGMAPDEDSMAETPAVYHLLSRALFTKSGDVHRADRAASIAAFNTIALDDIVRSAIDQTIAAINNQPIDLRYELLRPIVRAIWAGITGLTPAEALQLETAVRDLGYVVSPAPEPDNANLAEQAAGLVHDLAHTALDSNAPFSRALHDGVGGERAAELIAGMAFDAIDTSATGLDAALRVALAHRSEIRPTSTCANECLRVASSTALTMRQTTGSITLGDVVMEPGTTLSMIWAAGNHDPLAFARPERFDPDRQGTRPLMFGMGPHACLGHAVVRTTLTHILGMLGKLYPERDAASEPWMPLSKDYLPPLAIKIHDAE